MNQLIGTATHLGQVVPSWEPSALFTLHQSSGRVALAVVRSADADIAAALLNNNAENDALFDTHLGGFCDSYKDPTNVVPCATRIDHGLLVDVEDCWPRLPAILAGVVGS